ncbi:anti sigma-E protein, RseA [Colwellia chukchiensis]|uniref:Anti-sigma-E factor RseA n=1 Tax=Colwellia chukchiensis TaxID=641665 RepID=A0A1H7JE48_9GAMM|nr:RseA family anti-sigma factor [Colwellia chukchiensis]SEK72806.1 anti sigma-E protein, RseA [Colwellia chukchiensis]
MSENKLETVSSVADSYQANDEFIEELLNDAHLSATWERYHLVGDVMRGETSATINLDIAAQIATAIDKEPSIVAPVSSATAQRQVNKVKATLLQFTKPFAQVAIAASAAGLMVLGVQQNSTDNETLLPATQVVKTMPLGGVAEPVSLNFQPVSRTSEKQAFIAQQRRFQALLADHQQQIKLSSVDSSTSSIQNKAEDPAK